MITSNLDENVGLKYNELFEKIIKNMNILQIQNLNMIKLNKEIIWKFNNQLNNLKHNEEILSTQIVEKNEILTNYNWRIITTIKDTLNQLILLAVGLHETL